MFAGRDKKSELLQEQGRGAEREEEEFAVSAARESEHRKQGEKRGGSARGKSKKRQFKVGHTMMALLQFPFNYIYIYSAL